MDNLAWKNKYLKYKTKYLKLKKDNSVYVMKGGNSNSEKTVYLFKANWCGHCKAFLPVWEKLQNNVENIKFVTFDSEKDKDKMREYGISGFPTIILKNNNKAIEYVGVRDYDSVLNFINNY